MALHATNQKLHTYVIYLRNVDIQNMQILAQTFKTICHTLLHNAERLAEAQRKKILTVKTCHIRYEITLN